MIEADARVTVAKPERRTGARLAVALDALSEHHLWSDLSMSVDSGGVFVATYHHLPLGTVVELELTLPDDEGPITAKGVVRWTRGHHDDSAVGAGVGIKLIEVEAEVGERLERFATTVREPMLFDLDDAPVRRRSGAPSAPHHGA